MKNENPMNYPNDYVAQLQQGKIKEELRVTLTKPVRRSRFKCRFLISPYSPKAFCKSSSCASSCTPVTRMIHPSMAGNKIEIVIKLNNKKEAKP